VTQIVIVEGIFVGLLSWLLAAVFAYPMGYIMSITVGISFIKSPLVYGFAPAGILIWLVVVVILSIIASVIPARSATKLVVREALERQAGRLESDITGDRKETDPTQSPFQTGQQTLNDLAEAMPAPPTLDTLCATFNLSPFERDLLLLCAGMELEASFATLCATAQGDPQRPYPTFSLALAALPEAHWSAVTPAAPLRHWRLVEVGSGSTLMTSPLRLDERVLHYLTGVPHLDEHLLGFIQPVPPASDPVPSHGQVAERLATLWSQAARRKTMDGTSALPVVQLCGPETAGKRTIAVAACALLGLNLHRLPAQVIPTGPHELDILIRLWEREAALSASALLLDCEEVDHSDAPRESAITRFIEGIGGALILTSQERRTTRQRLALRPLITFEVQKPTPAERRTLWQGALGSTGPALNGQQLEHPLDHLVSQFDLSAPVIQAVCSQALGELSPQESSLRSGGRDYQAAPALDALLWEACRTQARPQLDDLAQRIDPVATWDDLVLPPTQLERLCDAALHVRQRAKVYEAWGFAAKSSRGLGISALFAGASGTGKTMAAEVLANELRLDLYRIDLSQVVSKYIGETEKNLRRVFDAAEEGGAILLFDEADALFGKRSEVKDSHDRYANIEISYLLQRMEAYRGLAILTTNMKKALDNAFLRRIRFIVQFPFPDAAQRTEIWRRVFPAETPTEGLEAGKLAQLNVAGGNIRNIALNAAFLAADAGQPVGMAHILQAAHSEYAKLEKPLTNAEIRGWV